MTGTVGKTTSREMLRHVLDRQGGATATRGNNNNIAGVSRSMAYTPRDYAYAVLEMGFGLPLGGIAKSSQLVRPHVSLLTALGLAHLDVFGGRGEWVAGLYYLGNEESLQRRYTYLPADFFSQFFADLEDHILLVHAFVISPGAVIFPAVAGVDHDTADPE